MPRWLEFVQDALVVTSIALAILAVMAYFAL